MGYTGIIYKKTKNYIEEKIIFKKIINFLENNLGVCLLYQWGHISAKVTVPRIYKKNIPTVVCPTFFLQKQQHIIVCLCEHRIEKKTLHMHFHVVREN